jgi:hypothetical protein
LFLAYFTAQNSYLIVIPSRLVTDQKQDRETATKSVEQSNSSNVFVGNFDFLVSEVSKNMQRAFVKMPGTNSKKRKI